MRMWPRQPFRTAAGQEGARETHDAIWEERDLLLLLRSAVKAHVPHDLMAVHEWTRVICRSAMSEGGRPTRPESMWVSRPRNSREQASTQRTLSSVSVSSLLPVMAGTNFSGWRALTPRPRYACSAVRTGEAPGGLTGRVAAKGGMMSVSRVALGLSIVGGERGRVWPSAE